MRVLGLDTATRATAVAVLDTETGSAHERRDDPPAGGRPQHTARLLALAADALAEAGTDWSGIGLIAVGTGPGTFTGIRIGIATARALALAREVPLVGVCTLQALAARAAEAPAQTTPHDGARATTHDGAQPTTHHAPPTPLAVLDARRREVFVGAWHREDVGRAGAPPLLAPRAIAPDALPDLLAGESQRWLAVGDGALLYRGVLEAAGACVLSEDSPLHRVSAAEVCRLALSARAGAADEVRPDYLREPDATPSRQGALPR